MPYKYALVVVMLSLAIPAHTACAIESDVISNGKTVTIDYTLTVENKIIASSTERDPIQYVHGKLDTLLPTLQQRLEGKRVGDHLIENLSVDEAYGPVNTDAFVEVSRLQFPDGEIKIGSFATTRDEQGNPVRARVKEVLEDTVVLDFNHPLAGKELSFDINIRKITS